MLRKCDETSLTVIRIVVSLTLKWEVAVKAVVRAEILPRNFFKLQETITCNLQ